MTITTEEAEQMAEICDELGGFAQCAAALRSFAAERDALKAENASLRATRKWNIERDGEDLLICEGGHERHEACVAQRWVKSETAAAERDALKAENEKLRAALHKARARYVELDDKDAAEAMAEIITEALGDGE